MFELFYLDVVKVYLDVALHAYCKCKFQVFHVFHTYVLQLDVAKIDLDVAYAVRVIHACFKCFTYF